MVVNPSELENYNQQRGIGGAAAGAAGGAAAGSVFGPVGTAIGGIGGALAGGFGGGQQTQQPFDVKLNKVPDAAQSGFMTGIFGTQGNYNPNALLPTNQTIGAYQPPQPTNGLGQGFQQGQVVPANQGMTFQQQNQPQTFQNAVSQGGQPLQNYLYNQGATNQQMGGYNQIPFNNNLGLNKNIAQAESQGYNPYQDQLNMQSSGLANTGLGFQNIQNQMGQSNQLIGQGQNLVNQGQQQYQQGDGNLQNTIGQNAGQFQDYFGGIDSTLGQAGQYTSQAANMAGYSPQTINQAYGLAGQAAGLAGQVPGDLDMARQFAQQDRAQRGGLINQGTGTGLDQTSLNIADQIRQSSLQSAISNITGGAVGDRFANEVSAAQANAASRGLGIGSSPVISAQQGVQKEIERLLAEAQNQANQ